VIFNETKATQTAARFLHLASGRMNYMVLVKLLYLADREALLRWGRPMTFDTFYTMKLGPVLSNVLNLITEPSLPEEGRVWPQYISAPTQYEVELLKEAGDSELSEAEEELIDEIFAQFKDYISRPFPFADLLHDILPEVKRIESGRIPLEISDILRANHKSLMDIAAIEQELDGLAQVADFIVHR
jgi:Protein of unknown function (DUF4065)